MIRALPLVLRTALAVCLTLTAYSQPVQVTEVPANSSNFVEAGGYVYFISGDDLWRTDGTSAGTLRLATGIDPSPYGFWEFNGLVIFLTGDDHLWKTDGTPGGTTVLSTLDEISIAGWTPTHFYFGARTAAAGKELYRSDGTVAGTVMVADLNPGPGDGYIISFGTIGQQVVFSGTNGVTGTELWKTDGTAAGTVLVKDINPGPGDGIVDRDFGYSLNGQVFFRGFTAATGSEPWVTDGTAAGTTMLVDLKPGVDDYNNVYSQIEHDGDLYFFAIDEEWHETASLWATSGSPSTTRLLKSDLADVAYFIVHNDLVYFWQDYGAVYGGIVRTDGTAAGTENAGDFLVDGGLIFFESVDDHLIFIADFQAMPTNIYKSDGGPGDPVLLKEINAQAYYVYPRSFVKVGDRFYYADHDGPSDRGYGGHAFAAEDHYHLFEGNSEGAVSMRTLWGINTIGTDNITPLGTNLVFTTYDDYDGSGGPVKELWFYNPSVRPPATPKFFLVSPSTDKDLKRMIDGTTIAGDPYASNVPYNIRFEPSVTAASVVFEHDGVVVRTESAAPYSIGGDVNGDFAPWYPEPGTHTLTARAHSAAGGGGSVLESLTITYHVPCTSEDQGCIPTGGLLVERWRGVGGNTVASIPVNTSADEVETLASFEEDVNNQTNYGARMRGFVVPPQTGMYTFWIASNDHSELWLSTDETVANKRRIAYVNGATNPQQWNKFPSQRSVQVSLVQGQRYYIEALLKQGAGSAHLSVRWQMPDGTFEGPIPGSRLAPFQPGSGTAPDVEITNPVAGQIFNASDEILIEATAEDGDDGVIVRVDFYATPTGGAIEKIGEDHTAPYSFLWQDVIPGSYEITAFAVDDDGNIVGSAPVDITVNAETTAACTASGEIDWEVWLGVSGNEVSRIPLHRPSDTSTPLTMFESVPNYGTNYGGRIRGYICAPQTGNYTFWIASNDHSELWLSADDDPANKVRIAWLDRATGPREWSRFPSQRSVSIWLEAGQRYYIEGLHKQGVGGDHFAAGWQLPDGTLERPIAGAHLSPFSSGSTEARIASTKEADAGYAALAVYPNPARAGYSELVLGGYENLARTISTRVTIRNMTGEVVYSGRVNCGGDCASYPLNVDRPLSAGLYLIEMETEGARHIRRLVIEE